MATRVRLKLQLFLLENGKVVSRATKQKKSKALLFFERGLTSERTGRCRVWYNVREDYWNEFEFKTIKQFKEVLGVDTEKDLVATFA